MCTKLHKQKPAHWFWRKFCKSKTPVLAEEQCLQCQLKWLQQENRVNVLWNPVLGLKHCNCLELIQKGKWCWGFTRLRRTQSQLWAFYVPLCNTQDKEVSYNFIAISPQIGSVALQLVTLPTVVVSLFSLPYKTPALFLVLKIAVKAKFYVCPLTQAVKIVNSSTFFLFTVVNPESTPIELIVSFWAV